MIAAWRCSNCFVAMQQLLCRDAATNYLVELGQQREKKRAMIHCCPGKAPNQSSTIVKVRKTTGGGHPRLWSVVSSRLLVSLHELLFVRKTDGKGPKRKREKFFPGQQYLFFCFSSLIYRGKTEKRERICAFQADIPHQVGILPVVRIHFTCWKIAIYPGGEIKRPASRCQASSITLSIVRHHVAKHPATR